MSPCLRHPIESGQVRARSSSLGLDSAAFSVRPFHPSNRGADEKTSGAKARHAPCLRAFCRWDEKAGSHAVATRVLQDIGLVWPRR